MSNPAPADRPATFREVLAGWEFRSVFAASALSWFGDNVARAAVTAYVLHQTHSIFASAATYAISFLPWFGIGPVLSALAERHSYRKVMIFCDVVRMLLMAVVALPNIPVSAMVGLLVVTAMFNPPFESARSALLPVILPGDRYVVGLGLQRTASQSAIILGYVAGATLASYDARGTLLFNALTFGGSAVLVALGVRPRPPAMHPAERTNIFRETGAGFVIVFGSPVRRAIAVISFVAVAFSIVPEGLAAGWASHLTADPSRQGPYQALIMMSAPTGFMIGGLVMTRLVSPSRRTRLIKPLAVLASLVLVPAFLNPSVYGVAAMNAATGFMVAGLLPVTNSLFVQALPTAFRARAFGVMQSGLQLIQGSTVALAGVVAERLPVPEVVGGWGLVGVVVTLCVLRVWPQQPAFDAAIAEARRADTTRQAGAEPPDTAPQADIPRQTDAARQPDTPGQADAARQSDAPGQADAVGQPGIPRQPDAAAQP